MRGKRGDEAEGRQDVGGEIKEESEGRQEMKPRGETGGEGRGRKGGLVC